MSVDKYCVTMGKAASGIRRLTFVTELGVEGSRRQALAMAEDGKSAILERFGACHEAGLLIDVIEQSLSGVVKPSLATDMVG
jgi:hypothetical protein